MGKKHEINEGDTHEPLLEWTDNTNRLLGYIQENLVRSHKLRYRRLVLLIGDESGHLLFRLHNDNCLALPVLRDMPAGRSFADVASETCRRLQPLQPATGSWLSPISGAGI